MVICKFFQQGNCRFGNNCRYEHPGGSNAGTSNRFSTLQNGGNRSNSGSESRRDSTFNIVTSDVQNDLTDGSGRPKWILSTYGPGKNPSASLFEGNEYSSEEIRLRFYELSSQGKEAEADQEAIALWNKAAEDMSNVARNVDKVASFLEEASNKHPNRYDFCRADGTTTREDLAKAVISGSSSAGFDNGGGFGAGSGFGNNTGSTNPFSRATSPPTSAQNNGGSILAKPALGNPAAPAFGQSGFGAGTGFSGSSGAFGKPPISTAFGQPAAQSAFGQPAFGSSGFGQPAQSSSRFGQNTQGSALGQPAQPSGFGSSGFGQQPPKNPFAPASASGGFGSSSPAFGQSTNNSSFGQQPQTAPAFGQSGFGQAAQTTSPFGQAAPAAGFGQSSFGQPSFGNSGFGQSPQPSSSLSQNPLNTGFGKSISTPFGAAGRSTGFGQSALPNNPFGVRPAHAEPNDQSMETPIDARPPTRENPFGAAGPPFGSAANNTSHNAMAPPASRTAIQPVLNTSSTPHPLTGQPPKALHYTEILPSQPSQTDNSGRLTSYRGRSVRYIDQVTPDQIIKAKASNSKIPTELVPCYQRPDGKGWERIWFPSGGAGAEVVPLGKDDKLPDLEAPPEAYTEEVKDQYRHLFETGEFKDGLMPLIPPMHAWTLYDI